jgi:hypothetical protein
LPGAQHLRLNLQIQIPSARNGWSELRVRRGRVHNGLASPAEANAGSTGDLPVGLYREREEPMQRNLRMQQRQEVPKGALLREEGNPLPQRQGVLLRQVLSHP